MEKSAGNCVHLEDSTWFIKSVNESKYFENYASSAIDNMISCIENCQSASFYMKLLCENIDSHSQKLDYFLYKKVFFFLKLSGV